MSKPLDLVTVGRVSVDLYGQQIGSRLEDVSSFSKAVGGCPANIAIGAARLGLKSALISRVGDEPMGRFVREQLAREGVDTRGLLIDWQRLTSLVLLSVRDDHTFPLIFYRDNCADSALAEADIDEQLIASSRAVLVTGTHFSIAEAARAQRRVINLAKAHGGRVILDIDYRPNLWGMGGHGAGESRYAPSQRVTGTLASVLEDCDLIVGTEEELHVAAGVEDTLAAVRHIRSRSDAVIVCKRGPKGCVVFERDNPESLEDGITAPGMEVEVYNVLGAGDAFMAGFLSGWLRDEPHEVSARLGNACGAIAVSRLLCSPEFPTRAELDHYLAHGSKHRRLRDDARLSHLHWATTRGHQPSTVLALSLNDLDHSRQSADGLAISAERAAHFELLAIEALTRLARKTEGFGVLLNGTQAPLLAARGADRGLWLAASVHEPASRPLEFAGSASLALQLLEWPIHLTVACRCWYRCEDPPDLRQTQARNLLRLASVCRAQRRELFLQILTAGPGESLADAAPEVIARLLEIGLRPDWWGLEPQPSAAAWQRCAATLTANDELCRGVLACLPDAPIGQLARTLALAASCPIVRGFTVGRTIIEDTALAWLAGEIPDETAIARIAERFGTLAEVWFSTRGSRQDPPERSPS